MRWLPAGLVAVLFLVEAAVLFRGVRLVLFCACVAFVWWKIAGWIGEDYSRAYDAWCIAQQRFYEQHPILASLGFGHQQPSAGSFAIWTIFAIAVTLFGFMYLP